MLEHEAIPICNTADSALIAKFFEADSLDEQRELFKQLPLQEIQTILRCEECTDIIIIV